MDVLGCHDSLLESLFPGRSELTAQWERILALGPKYPVTLDDFSLRFRGMGIGALASELFLTSIIVFSDFIHAVVVHRRDDSCSGVAELDSGKIL